MADLDTFKNIDLIIDSANSNNLIPRQFSSVGDISGRTLTVQLAPNGVPASSSGAILRAVWTNLTSGITSIDDFEEVDSSNGIYIFTYPEIMNTRGTVEMAIQIYFQGKVTTTRKFNIDVQGINGNFSKIIQSQQFYALTKALNEATKANPRDKFESINELQSAYPNGSVGTYLVKSTDGTYHSYMFKNGSWQDLGAYQGVIKQEEIIDLINNQRSFLPSNYLTDAIRIFNGKIRVTGASSANNEVGIYEYKGYKAIKVFNQSNFNGIQGIDFIPTNLNLSLQQSKTVEAYVAVDGSTKFILQAIYQNSNNVYQRVTLDEKFITSDDGYVKLSGDLILPLNDIKLETLIIRVAQSDSKANPIYIRNWSMTEMLERKKQLITNDHVTIYDRSLIKREKMMIANTQATKFSLIDPTKKTNVRIQYPLTKTNGYDGAYSSVFYKYALRIKATIYLTLNNLANSLERKEVNLYMNYLDSSSTSLFTRKIGTVYFDNTKTVASVEFDYDPFQNDATNASVNRIALLIQTGDLEGSNFLAVNDLDIQLQSKNYDTENIPDFIKRLVVGSNNVTSTYLYNRKLRNVVIESGKSGVQYGELYIVDTSKYNMRNKIRMNTAIYNPNQNGRYAIEFYQLDKTTGAQIGVRKTRYFTPPNSKEKEIGFETTLKDVTYNSYAAFRIVYIPEVDGNFDFYYRVPEITFLSNGDTGFSGNLFGNNEYSYQKLEDDVNLNTELFRGRNWINLNTTIQSPTDYDKNYGRAIRYTIDNPRDVYNSDVSFNAKIYSKNDSKALVTIVFSTKDKPSEIYKSINLGTIDLISYREYDFNYILSKNFISTVEESENLYWIQFIVRALPNDANNCELSVSDVSAKIIAENKNENIVENKVSSLSLPTFNILGDLTGITKDNKVSVILQLLTDNGKQEYYATAKLQGDSSLAYPKKAFRIDFFSDEARKSKLKIAILPNDKPRSSINLKANWVDWTSANNQIISNYHKELCLINNDSYDERLKYNPTQEQCVFYPCNVLLNGQYYGLFTCSSKKGNAIDVDTDNPNEIAIQGIEHNDYSQFKVDEAVFDENVDFEIVDGKWTDELKASFNELMKLVNSGTDEELKAKIADKVNLQSIANVFTVNISVGNRDMFGKNTTWQTFDGKKWYAISYDHDLAWGQTFDASSWLEPGYSSIKLMMDRSKLIKRLIQLKVLQPYLKTAYSKFMAQRNIATIRNDYEQAMLKIGSFNYLANAKRWPNQPGVNFYTQADLLVYIQKHLMLVSEWFTDEYLNSL